MIEKRSSAWIHSAGLDSLLILIPPFVAVLVAFLLRNQYAHSQSTPLYFWVFLVVGIDVAHVYATLFRTYWKPESFKQRNTLFLLLPLFAWLGGVFLYSMGALIFWQALAYLAVFHFVRQQYGFVRIYSRLEKLHYKWIDACLIYLTTLYPLIYWHTHLPRNFVWFVEGDFLNGLPAIFESIGLLLYGVFAVAYLFKEIWLFKIYGQTSVPKHLIFAGTALSWYFGIVTFNGDVVFTLINVVSHGIPYMGLVWLIGRKEQSRKAAPVEIFKHKLPQFYSWSKLPLFVVILLLLAFLEEGLWDGFVWRDHAGFFWIFSHLPMIRDPETLMWLIPFLALPQSTHYLLDGFIWRSVIPSKIHPTGEDFNGTSTSFTKLTF